MLNARKGSTPLSYQIQPGAQYLYDYVTRRAVRYVETIVPTLNLAEDDTGVLFPSDRYYGILGPITSAAALPLWMVTGGSGVTFGNYDTGTGYWYCLGGGVSTDLYDNSKFPIIWPTGPFQNSPSYGPKNATSAAVWIKSTQRFNDNADYTTYGGIGGISVGASRTSGYADSAGHFIQVTRNGSNWELGTCDGSTISQAASIGGADGNFHEFAVRWSSTDVKLYVDGELVITKTTNRPNRPLCPAAFFAATGKTVHTVDYLIEWELA